MYIYIYWLGFFRFRSLSNILWSSHKERSILHQFCRMSPNATATREARLPPCPAHRLAVFQAFFFYFENSPQNSILMMMLYLIFGFFGLFDRLHSLHTLCLPSATSAHLTGTYPVKFLEPFYLFMIFAQCKVNIRF